MSASEARQVLTEATDAYAAMFEDIEEPAFLRGLSEDHPLRARWNKQRAREWDENEAFLRELRNNFDLAEAHERAERGEQCWPSTSGALKRCYREHEHLTTKLSKEELETHLALVCICGLNVIKAR